MTNNLAIKKATNNKKTGTKLHLLLHIDGEEGEVIWRMNEANGEALAAELLNHLTVFITEKSKIIAAKQREMAKLYDLGQTPKPRKVKSKITARATETATTPTISTPPCESE